MPKSKKRRKNGSVVSRKEVKSRGMVGYVEGDMDQLDDEVLTWVFAHGYDVDLIEMAYESGYRGFLDHLREGYRCAQSGEPWTYMALTKT